VTVTVGQQYRHNRTGNVREVVAIDDGWHWLKLVSSPDGAIPSSHVSPSEQLLWLDYTLIEPFFEEGKTYKIKGSGSSFRFTARKVFEIDGRKFAVAFNQFESATLWDELFYPETEEV
jgi:hypothetical protein